MGLLFVWMAAAFVVGMACGGFLARKDREYEAAFRDQLDAAFKDCYSDPGRPHVAPRGSPADVGGVAPRTAAQLADRVSRRQLEMAAQSTGQRSGGLQPASTAPAGVMPKDAA